MSSKSKKKKEFLSDKISKLFTVAPRADLEDDVVFNSKPKTVTKDDLDSDGEVEATLSNFRKQNVKLLADISSKYAGEVSSRKRQDSDENKESDEEVDEDNDAMSFASDDEDEEEEEVGEEADDDENVDESDVEDGSEELSNEEDDFDDSFDISQANESQGSFKHMKEKDLSEESSKGNCVRNQLLIWENLLEMRISLQKCLVTANKMPLTDTFTKLKTENPDDFNPAVAKTKGKLTTVLNKLLDMQEHLLGQFSETKNILNSQNDASNTEEAVDDDMDEEIPSDSEPEEEKPVDVIVNRKRKRNDYSTDLSERHASYKKYRNAVIEKWHDKVKVATRSSKNQPTPTSILSQIEFLLNDRNKLIKRTQLKRSKYDIVGVTPVVEETVEENATLVANPSLKSDDEYCKEIFDDDDYYHQLLRELIEYKSSDVSDPIQLSRQWIALQQLRSKMKRKIDTRATKGRRLRYAVHTKLVNFMAPQKNNDWTDESKNELFASLFGRQYEDPIN